MESCGSPDDRSTAAAASAPVMPLRGCTWEYLAKVRLTFICAHRPNRSGTIAVTRNRVTSGLQLVSVDQSKVSPPCGPPAPGAKRAVLTKPADGILPF